MKTYTTRSHVMRMLITLGAVCMVTGGAAVQATDPGYLIVSHADFDGPALNDLVALQQSRGFSVISQFVSDGVSLDSIKQAVSNAYDAGGLKYVLLVGAHRTDGDTLQWDDAYANAGVGNFIPAYKDVDCAGYNRATDYWYAAVDSKGWSDPLVVPWPNIVIGRLPVIDTNDVRVYVNKLTYYLNDQSQSDWKDEVLLLSGDIDRGPIGGGVPTPGQINHDMSVVDDLFRSEFSTRTVKYSDFGEPDDRQQAVASQLDSGRALVYTMATGSNAQNISYMIGRSADGFDALQDLSANNKYSVWIAASCNLGQSDYVADGGIRLWPEHLLFTPNRGAIVYVAPAGGTKQNENMMFLYQFTERLNSYPGLSVGELCASAQSANTSGIGDYATLRLYTVYGDPSLPLNTNPIDDLTPVSFGFEFGEPQPYEDLEYSDCSQVSSNYCGISTIGGQWGAERIYNITGLDASSTESPCYESWLLFDDLGLTIGDSTRFLQYTIWSGAHPEGVGRFGLNGVLNSGSLLSDAIGRSAFITDQYGTRIGASQRQNSLGNAQWFVFDLLQLDGEELDELILEYSASDPASQGAFEFSLISASFSSDWGSAPEVSEIDAPSSMLMNRTATLSLDAIDNDEPYGDDLTYEWTASAGSFTGNGSSVTYYSPGQTQTVQIGVTVSDKGNHVVARSDAITITQSQGGGCPFLYVYSGGEYVFDNVILTGSEDITRSSEVTVDYYPLRVSPEIMPGGKVLLRVTEEEKELSHIYSLNLVAYDVPALSREEQLSISDHGDLLILSDPVSPLLAIRDNSFDVVDKVKAADGDLFVSHGKGELTLTFDLRDFYSGNGKALAGEGGGIPNDPPGKDPIPRKIATLDHAPSFLTISHQAADGSKDHVANVFPRKAAALPYFTDLSPYISAGNANWFEVVLGWERDYCIDQLAFYRYRSIKPCGEAGLANARHSEQGDVTSLLDANNGKFVTLRPGQHIDFIYETAGLKQLGQNTVFVVEAVGFYQPDTKPGARSDGPVPNVTDVGSHPNPFNAGTEISFTLSSGSDVTLTVYNILGQAVRSLHEGYLPPGQTSVHWDGTDDHGGTVSSGVYFYRLRTDYHTDTKKMILIK